MGKKPADHALPPDASPVSGVAPPKEHRWKPGQSGNPKGRPPLGLSLIERVNLLGESGKSIAQITAMAEDETIDFRDQAAAKRVLELIKGRGAWHEMCDRTAGKPKQSVEVTTTKSDDPLDALREAQAEAGLLADDAGGES